MGAKAGRWASLPFGAVSLTERFLRSDPPEPDEIEALEAEVWAGIMHHCALMPEKVPLLIGVGGTVTVLASMDRQLETYDPALLEGWTIRPERLSGLVERLRLIKSALGYVQIEKKTDSLPDADVTAVLQREAKKRRDAITDEGLVYFHEAYPGEQISKEDVFYYVYGLLHSPEYRERYAENLSKELPRIPRVKAAADFWSFESEIRSASRPLSRLISRISRVSPGRGVSTSTMCVFTGSSC